ncbi:uncharacterized protein LOC135088524 [Ostrinia nubilalis]|uniref:uncharacterized protein LOC135088524 n=1 Tax=Ostrinia nubilalis TaxID=29057 RepID=UPI0030824E17
MQQDHVEAGAAAVDDFDESSWDACPPELLLMIFDYFNPHNNATNAKTLINCMCVNKKWFDIASSLIKHRIGLHTFLKIAVSDGGASFRKRCKLPTISDVLFNMCLWKDIKFTQVQDIYTYDITEVLNINVYRNNLIVITNKNVRYYHLPTHKLLKTLAVKCLDFDENDYMFVKIEHTTFDMQHFVSEEMTLYGKHSDSNYALDDRLRFNAKIKFFRIYDNCCYYTTWAFTIFVAKWHNNSWMPLMVGRYFGYGSITDVIVHQDDIVALLNWGGMLMADIGNIKLKLISKTKTSVIFDLPFYASKSILYERYGAIVTVPSCHSQRVGYNGSYWTFECPGLRCTLKHGNLLILGYKSGKVDIYNPEFFFTQMSRLEPEVTLSVQSLGSYENADPSVRFLEVAEMKGRHILVIVTSSRIHQVTLHHRLFHC